MAPMAVHYPPSLKRTSSIAQFDEPAAKKLNRGLVRHHKASWDLQPEFRQDSILLDHRDAQSLLTRSIGLALEAVGFEAAAPEAIDSFRGDVEEYMAHYLAGVRQSMLSCRRTSPVAQDFLQALHTHQLSLRALLPHLDPPVPPERSQYPLQADPSQDDDHRQLELLAPILNGALAEQANGYVPKHFPNFPSRHTYKATADFPEREINPRKVRERATEEGRLGEEALRKFVGTGFGHAAQAAQQQQSSKSMRAKREQMFMETMAALSEGAEGAMDIDMDLETSGKGKQKEGDLEGSKLGRGRLQSAVNFEKKYWRKPARHKGRENESS